MTRRSWYAAIAFITSTTFIQAACSGDAEHAQWSATDSAGVTIVESRAPAWDSAGAWRVDSEPALDVTEAGEGADYQFTRVVGVARFGDGRIVVGDAGSNDVRVYGADGTFLTRVGAAGDGPGEFRRLGQVWAIDPDTILAFDGIGRLTRFSAAGELLGVVELGRPGPSPWSSLSRFADGTFVATVGWSSAQLKNPSNGLLRIDAPVLLVDPGAPAVDTLVTLPGSDIFFSQSEGGAVMGSPPLARWRSALAVGASIVTGAGDGLAYEVRDRTGALERIVRVSGYDLSGAGALIDSIIEAQTAMAPQSRAREMISRLLHGLPVPAERPGYSVLLADPDGNVWAAQHRGPIFLFPANRWEVFSAEGRWLGTVRAPERFRVLRIERDALLGYFMDDLDVQHVRLYRILKDG